MEYNIKGIDKDFWKKVKMVALQKDTTVKNLIMNFLKEIVKDSGMGG